MNWVKIIRFDGTPCLVNLAKATHITTDKHGDTFIWFGDCGVQTKATASELETLIMNLQKEKKQ